MKVPWAIEGAYESENYSSNVTVQLFTLSDNSLKYQFEIVIYVYMSQVMSCLFIIHIDELVGLGVHVYPYINGDKLLWSLMF